MKVSTSTLVRRDMAVLSQLGAWAWFVEQPRRNLSSTVVIYCRVVVLEKTPSILEEDKQMPSRLVEA